ncbi:long-chain fatty acid transport protein-like protein [Dermatophagoides farinae]|uniref:Long-chain-fatty-acid--CoA ligase n=1 Tax=Dermatophagoides farinae TaxID=6954 RepID=A0A9D4P4H7_DERFA|nr:long-chain fatty acid transport protein-like protein [Dermatophagoides farinae]
MAEIIGLIRKLPKLFFIMIFRDLVCAILFFTFQIRIRWIIRRNRVLVKYFDYNVRRHPNKTAINYNGECFTFQNVYDLAQKISNWIEESLQLGHDDEWERCNSPKQTGDDDFPLNREAKIYRKFENNARCTQIGLMFGNIPELASFIIGIARVRCSAVLFNTNNRRDLLLNAFHATNCKVFIFESKFLSAIQEIAPQLPDIRFFMYDRNESKNILIDPHYNGISRQDLESKYEDPKCQKFAAILNAYPITMVKKNYPYKMSDMIQFMFTSGTTGGNIKCVPVDNIRYIGGNLSHELVFGFRHSDHFYVCLPCYHAFAGVIGLSTIFITGNTITLADKFSASKFWNDCRINQCTIALYIGEICRYLLAQPEHSDDQRHSLRMMFGLGLNKEHWIKIRKRFNIPKIAEYYGSSEGNILIANHQNVPGSCGFIPYYYGPLLYTLWPCHIIKVDPITLELVRDSKTGLCKMARNGDLGMMVGEIRKGQIFTEYLGYTSAKESTKKLIRNVRQHGDFVFISGDLMEMDFYGNLYFKDRTGDTYRWKGENVSTTEIESIITQFINHQDCIVYGVIVPGHEGRCGMLAINSNNNENNNHQINLDSLYEFMKNRIPEYAIPKFIRFTRKIQLTSTQKYIKYPLREQGIDLNRLTDDDQIYYFDRIKEKYHPMNHDIYDKIINGFIQF